LQLWSPDVTTFPIPNRIIPFTSGETIKGAVPYLPTLRLFFDGGVSNDYRLHGDVVEFRTNKGKWRALNDSELAIHFRFDTEVARWLLRHSINANPHSRKVR